MAPGYRTDVLIRWGDAVPLRMPAFDVHARTAAAQKPQFGYSNDLVGNFPIEGSSEHDLLVVNQEYANEEPTFPGLSGLQGTKEAGFPNDQGPGRWGDGRSWRLRARDP